MKGLHGIAWWLLFAWYTSPLWGGGLVVVLLRRENRAPRAPRDKPCDEELIHEIYDYLQEQDRETSE